MSVVGSRNGGNDGAWFAGCFLIGVSLLLLLRWPAFLDQSAVVAAVVLCTLIACYAYALWRRGHFRLRRDDRAADNLYYLGFMFTVCALGVSLYRFSVSEADRVADIVGDLGIGISTTVLGLFLRVLFLQREEPEEVEDRVRRELVDVAEATASQIRLTASIVEQGQILTRQVIDELNESAKESATRMTDLMEEIDRQFREVEIPPDLVAGRLNPILEELARSIRRFAQRVNEVEVPPEAFARSLDVAVGGLRESAPALRQVVLQFGDQLRDCLADARSQVEDTLGRVEAETFVRLKELKMPAREIDQRTPRMLDRFEENAKQMEQLLRSLEQIGNTVEDAARALVESPRAAMMSLESLQKEIIDRLARQLNTIGERLESVDMKRIAGALDNVASVVAGTRKLIGTQQDMVERQTEALNSISIHNETINGTLDRILETLQLRSKRRFWPFNR